MFWYKRYKKRKEDEKIAEKALYGLREKLAEKIISEYSEDMRKRPCPINAGKNCFDGCVHFSDGFTIPSLYISDYFITIYPKCKLWVKDQ